GGFLPRGGRRRRSRRRWTRWSRLGSDAACPALSHVGLLRNAFGLICIFVGTPFVPTCLGGLLPIGGRCRCSSRCTRRSGLCSHASCTALRDVCLLSYAFGLICVLIGSPLFLASLHCLLLRERRKRQN